MSANDPQIGPQKIPGPKMFTSSVIKEYSQLKYLDNGFKHFFFIIFFYSATIITFKCFACKFYYSYNTVAGAKERF